MQMLSVRRQYRVAEMRRHLASARGSHGQREPGQREPRPEGASARGSRGSLGQRESSSRAADRDIMTPNLGGSSPRSSSVYLRTPPVCLRRRASPPLGRVPSASHCSHPRRRQTAAGGKIASVGGAAAARAAGSAQSASAMVAGPTLSATAADRSCQRRLLLPGQVIGSDESDSTSREAPRRANSSCTADGRGRARALVSTSASSSRPTPGPAGRRPAVAAFAAKAAEGTLATCPHGKPRHRG